MSPSRRSALVGLAALGLASAARAQTPSAGRPIVIGLGHDLPSTVLRETRRINVWLPPSYADGAQTYPVLYLLDGGEHEDFHHITGLVQVGAMNGFLREMIVVGIAGTDRKRDFTSPSSDPQDVKDLPTSGGSAAFRRFIAEELKPWVAAHYRVDGHTALIGESLAGLFVVETFLTQPALFDDYIAVSPSLWWDREQLSKDAPILLKASPPGARRLYLTIGDEGREMLSGVERLSQAITAAPPPGLAFIYAPRPTEKHAAIYNPAANAALRALFPAPPAA